MKKPVLKVDWSRHSQFEGPWVSPGFKLWQSHLTWQRQVNAALAPHGLTQPQFSILTVIGWLTRDRPSVSQNEIVVFTQMEPMHVSRIVRKLETRELVQRQRSTVDARAQQVRLTADGVAMIERTLPVVEAADQAYFAAG